MKLRWKILGGSAAMAGIVMLGTMVHHFQLKAAVEKYKAELKAKGEPMELVEVIPPSLPPEQNSASFFLSVVSHMATNGVLKDNPPPAMRGVALGKAMVGWAQPNIRSWEGTNSWEETKEALELNNNALNQLLEITNSARFDFDLQYAQRFEMRLTHLSLEKKAATRLVANALLALHSGDNSLAAKNIRPILMLVSGTRDERTAISQLVRIAIAQIAFTATWEFLQSPNHSEPLLAELQSEWSRPEFIRAAEGFMLVEREGAEATLTKWRNSDSELQRYFDLQKQVHEAMTGSDEKSPGDSFWSRAKIKSQIFLWRYWWSYQDELRYLKGSEVLLSTVRMVATNGSFNKALAAQDAELKRLEISELNSSLGSLFSNKTDLHSMQSESIVTLAGVIKKIMRVEVARQFAITAIALKRHQLKHGNYPADLNLLVPEFISAVPVDPVDGEPLRYRLNADGMFLLYSVGENRVDDGGNPAREKGVTSASFNWQNPHALDWVWPQPATAAEIQKYYEEQAKKAE